MTSPEFIPFAKSCNSKIKCKALTVNGTKSLRMFLAELIITRFFGTETWFCDCYRDSARSAIKTVSDLSKLTPPNRPGNRQQPDKKCMSSLLDSWQSKEGRPRARWVGLLANSVREQPGFADARIAVRKSIQVMKILGGSSGRTT